MRGRREWFHPAENLMDFIAENTVSLADAATAPIYDPGFRRYLPQGEVTEPSYPPNYVFNAGGEVIDILPEEQPQSRLSALPIQAISGISGNPQPTPATTK